MITPIGNVPPSRIVFICALLILGTFALFWPVTNYEFIGYDDPAYITQNPHVQAGLTKESIAWAFGNVASEATYWHPLSWMSHMLDCQLFGLNAGAHHLVSVGFHALNSLLLFFLLRGLTGSLWRSAAVAALFAWHPIQVESVAWVTERKNLLSTFFFLLTLLAYCRYSAKRSENNCPIQGFKTGSYWLVAVLFALGLMSKPMLVTLPCVLLLLDVWPLRRFNFQAPDKFKTAGLLFAEKLPLFVLSAISSWITIRAHQTLDMVVTGTQVPFDIRIANAALSYVSYIGKVLWPSDLAIIYPYPSTWPVSQFILTAVLLVSISALLFAMRSTRPHLLFGWCWFLGTLVPVIGILQVGSQPMADRFIYVPVIGLFFLAVWGTTELLQKIRAVKPVAIATVVLVAGTCMAVGRYHLQFWQNSIVLFERAIAVTSKNAVSHYNLGLAYSMKGDLTKAKINYTKALEISPVYVDAQNNLAASLLAEGRLDDAILEYQKLLKTAPNHRLANHNFGLALEQKNDFAGAASHFEVVVKAEPANLEAHEKMINALGRSGQIAEANRRLDQMLQQNPRSAQAHLSVANIYMEQNRVPDALPILRKAIELSPKRAEVHYQLGAANAMMGKLEEAMPHFTEAVRLKPEFAEAHFSIGMAHSQLGKTDDAVRKFGETLLVQPNFLPALMQLGFIWSAHEKPEFRNGPEAVKVAQKAAQLTQGQDAAVLELLAMAYAQSEKWPDAIETSRRALSVAKSSGDRTLAEQIETKVQAYEKFQKN
ncbi:MAG: tetratricopeptide repeat protein [Verrucomicrobia bacterium]|nr:tetratricopeptide repeat protein [Verrucomicrobiota bacterium]